MSMTKTPEEIEKLKRGGALLSRALKAAVDAVKPGVVISDIDKVAEKVIRDGGGTPSFLGYKTDPQDPPFPSTLCISINEEVVHGIGNRPIKLKEGDIVGLDIGCWYEGLCTDMAVTVPVGKVDAAATKLMQVTKKSLEDAVAAVKVGGLISDVGHAVEKAVAPHGYGIVRALVGHGVGHKVHEAPHVPNYVDPRYPKVKIKENMVLALEPMLGEGDWRVKTAADGWAVVMADGKRGAHFEVTIVVGKKGAEIITPLPV
jgi:methionyl aminopeptidase